MKTSRWLPDGVRNQFVVLPGVLLHEPPWEIAPLILMESVLMCLYSLSLKADKNDSAGAEMKGHRSNLPVNRIGLYFTLFL